MKETRFNVLCLCFFFNLSKLLRLYLHMCSSGVKKYIARVYTHNFGLPFPVYFIFKTLCPTFQLLSLPWILWSDSSNQGDHFSCDLSSSNIIQQGKAIGAFRLSFAIFYLEFIVLKCRMAGLRRYLGIIRCQLPPSSPKQKASKRSQVVLICSQIWALLPLVLISPFLNCSLIYCR